jgi:hypothetical protein
MKKSAAKNRVRLNQQDAPSIAEKLRIASELRDFQEKLAPLRAANRAERAAGKVEIRIKTR